MTTNPPTNQNQNEISLHFNDYWRVIKNRWPIIITVFVLVVVSALLYTKSQPPIYASSSLVKVEKRNPDITGVTPELMPERFDPIFQQTEFEVIQSKQVLYPVIDELQLAQSFGQQLGVDPSVLTKERIYSMLKGSYLQVETYRNTNLIEIKALSPDPDEAALISNTIARNYSHNRIKNLTERSESGLETLELEFDKQEAVVREARQKMEKLREDLELDVMGGGGAGVDVTTLQDITLQHKESQLSDAKADYDARKARVEHVANLSIDELQSALRSIGIDEPTVTLLRQNYLSAQSSLEYLTKEGLGEQHPRVKAARAQAKKFKEQLEKEVGGIKTGLRIDLSVAESRLASLEEEVKALRAKARGAKAKDIALFDEAKRKYDLEQSLLDMLAARIKQKKIDTRIPVRPVQIVEKAEARPIPVSPNVQLNMSLATAVGLAIGIALAFFIEYLDTSVKSLDDVERYLGTSVVGVIPEGVNALNLEGPDSPNAEAYRILRAKIDLQAKEDGAQTITIVSGGPGEGKTTTLFNLAYVCAYSGINTLVIDTDFRRHSMNTVMGIENENGLADFLMGYGPLHQYIRATDIPNLHVITAGKLPPHCMGALSPARMKEVIETLKPHYDVIFFDSPPILGISDAAVIVHEVDITLLVIQHRRYPRNISWRAKKVVDEVQGKLFGVVLNKVHLRSDESYYYYTSYYGYNSYYKTGSRSETAKKARKNKKRLDKGQALDVNDGHGGGDSY